MGRTPVADGKVGRVKSADRSLDVLELLAARPEGATFAQVVAALALPKSSAHALLQTLVARGYTALAPGERRFRLGPRVADLGAAYVAGEGVMDRARAAVADLAARTGETVHLATLDGVEVTYRLAHEGRHTMRFVSPLDAPVPAHATAAGKALLAALPNDEVARRYRVAAGVDATGSGAGTLPRRTRRTVATLDDLLRELDEVRRLGHAHDVEGFVTGVHCVAAAVPHGGRAAAISISVPTARLDGDRLHRLAAQVTAAAAGASRSAAASDGTGPSALGFGWRARSQGTIRIAWCMRQYEALVLREAYRAAARAAAALGADVLWTDAAFDERKQACDVRHALDLGPDVLVVHPAHTVESDALFRAAAARGIPAICFQRPARSGAFALFAGGDTYGVGVRQVEDAAEWLGGQGAVVMLEGDPYNDSARNLAEGNRAALARFPNLRLLADEACPDWSRDHARRVAAELIDRHGIAGSAADSTGPARGARAGAGTGTGGSGRPGIAAFVCANDGIAGAVIDALAALGAAGSALVIGHDGDRAALDRLRTGTQHATYFQNPSTLGVETLRAAVALARGEPLPERLPRRRPAVNPPSHEVPVLDVPYQRVTRDNRHVLEAYWRGVCGAA